MHPLSTLHSRLPHAIFFLLLFLMGCQSAAAPRAPDQVLSLRSNEVVREVQVFLSSEGDGGFFALQRSQDKPWISPFYPMWWVTRADLEGDGEDELVLGVWSWKKRHDEPEPHRAVWVLSQEGEGLREAWRGSALARPLVDLRLSEGGEGGPAVLHALERADFGCVVTDYRWSGFGFDGTPVAGSLHKPPCIWPD